MADSPVGAAGASSAGAAGAGSAAASIPLASALAGGPVSFVNADVALDGEPVVGSFTADGLTFAVTEGSNVELVGVSETAGALPRRVVAESQGLAAPDAPTDLGAASAASETEVSASTLVLPESVSFEGADYALTSIAPYAFYLSGVTSVELPASIDDVDDRAFRSSDVSSVEVDPSNESYASFDGILYDADITRLLLIPGGRTGAARISDKAEEVDAAAFSHCAGVTAISVDAGSDHLSSWDGLLYDADGTTLLRVPAGATDITIREGCTTIAAGALEGCASLAAITAPASVTSISPYLFEQEPEVVLGPVAIVAVDGDDDDEVGKDIPQITSLVALSAADDDLPETNPSVITVNLSEGVDAAPWRFLGFSASYVNQLPCAEMSAATTYAASTGYAFSAKSYVTLRFGDYTQGETDFNRTSTTFSRIGNGETWSPEDTGLTAYRLYQGYFWIIQNGITLRYAASSSGEKIPCLYAGTDAANLTRVTESATYTPVTAKTFFLVTTWYKVTLNANYVGASYSNQVYYLWRMGYVRSETSTNIIANGALLISGRPSRIGYVFAGFTGSQDGIGGTYIDKDGNLCTSTPFHADGTLFAKWTKRPVHAVSLSANYPGATYASTVWYWEGAGYVGAEDSEVVIAKGSRLVSELPSRPGYAFAGFTGSQDGTGGEFVDADGNLVTDHAFTKDGRIFAKWTKRPVHAVSLSANYPGATYASTVWYWEGAGYVGAEDSEVVIAKGSRLVSELPSRPGYVFAGFTGSQDGTGGEFVDADGNLVTDHAFTKDGRIFAKWEVFVSADVPLDVTAKVDLLGIEEQQEAAGYIESRCGEPLGVAAIELSPLSGASELFGAVNVADVALEVLVAGSTSPDARFALDASASQAPATPAAFRMASYGSRVPISYRFDIPEALLPTLVETTKPVCSVAYTVALA